VSWAFSLFSDGQCGDFVNREVIEIDEAAYRQNNIVKQVERELFSVGKKTKAVPKVGKGSHTTAGLRNDRHHRQETSLPAEKIPSTA
jgi:hypothetical protein